MLIVNELTNRWKAINATIDELKEEKRQIRKQISELGGTLAGLEIGRPATESNEKHEHMVALFKEGKTVREIAEIYGFSHQRAQQILKKNGLSRKDGGAAFKANQKHCLVDGCLNGGRFSLGYCIKHYVKFRRFGDPLAVVANRVHSDTCSVVGCNRPFKGRIKGIGYCNTHRTRMYLKGNVGEAEINPVGKHKDRGARTRRKLSDSQVAEIRALYVRGTSGQASEFSLSGLGKKYGVHGSVISAIVNNKIYLQ